MGTTAVDTQALRSAARHLDTAADVLQSVLSVHLDAVRIEIGPLRTALERLRHDLTLWRNASRDTAAALRISADRYSDTDANAAVALG